MVLADGTWRRGRRRTAVTLTSLLIIIAILPLAFPNLTTTSASAPPPLPSDFYGLWTLAPALVAIVLAIITRQVIVALACGIFTAAAMMCILVAEYNPLRFATFAMDHYLLGVLAPLNDHGGVNLEHITILIYTLFIGAMIGVLSASGGTRAVVERITRRVHSSRSGQISASLAGVAVFFDDYASAMIVGPGLRPIFDRLRLSREKLAYIVNWTAAPVSSLFLSTWLAAQIGYLDGGFQALSGAVPSFLTGVNANTTFWATIPYRVYPLLTIVMVFLVSLTGRDFGPLRRAEVKAEEQPASLTNPVAVSGPTPGHWILGALPALALIVLTLVLMTTTGLSKARADGAALHFDSFAAIRAAIVTIVGNADANYAMLYASLSAAVLSILLVVIPRTLTLAKTMEAAVSGMTHMFAACIILVLAWGLARASMDLQLGLVARDFLEKRIEAGTFSLHLLPLSVFVTACIISFATGTSWGTMALLCGPVVSISAGLLSSMPAGQALPLFYATVGAVMGGAVFGNTCSPLADITVLSSIFSECDLSAHVRTIMPYALVVAGVSVLSTDGMRYGLQRWAPDLYAHWSISWSLATAVLLLLLVLLVLGRPVVKKTTAE